MSKKIKINELKTDTRNHNRHTKDGMALLEKSYIICYDKRRIIYIIYL